MLCHSCDALAINGQLCHELGCPDKWQTEERECGWCGFRFEPESRHQACCSESCAEALYA